VNDIRHDVFTRSDEQIPPPGSWQTVLQLDEHGWLGLLNGEWCVGTMDKPGRLVDLDSPVWLLPIYERPRCQVLADISLREKELSMAEGSLVKKIPWDGLARCVGWMGSDFWAESLLDWCEGQPLTPTELEVFTQLSHSNWASQRVRHRAGIRVHRWYTDPQREKG